MAPSSTSFKQAICGSYGLLSGHIGINRAGGYGTVPELFLDEPEILGVAVKQGSVGVPASVDGLVTR